MADIFTIKLIKQSNYELLTSIPLIQSVEKSSRVGFISFGDFILKSTEVYLKNGKLKVKIRGYEGSVDLYLSGKEVVLYPTETVIMSTLCNKVSCIAIEGGYSFQSIVLSSQESLDNFRNEKEISFQSMGSGDPYIYEGRFVSDQVVETTQGYVFLNEHADIYLETEIKG